MSDYEQPNKYVISIIGTKGGSAKTLTGHILSHGLALRGFGAILATSDPRRNIRDDSNRRYDTYSAQTDENVTDLINHFTNIKIEQSSFVVLDGGASRTEADLVFAKTSSLILIPFLKDVEDIEVAISDIEFMRNNLTKEDFSLVKLLPSRFPSNPFLVKSTHELFDAILSDEHQSMLLKPVLEMSAAAKLNRPDAEKLPSEVNNLARALADQVLLELGEDPFRYLQPRRF